MVKFNVFLWSIMSVIASLPCIFAGFRIDYDSNSFSMDGRPFRFVSGSAHYFRMPHEYWRDRLRKIRAAGLNAVSTYVEWSQHEPTPEKYVFSGNLNITEYLKIAQEEDLYVLLRPGPYICAERDMGGQPFWLLTKHPNVYLRSSDPDYVRYVQRWMDILMPLIQPFLYGNGGPIILLQVENEYGNYTSCDPTYTVLLRDIFKRYLQDKAVLYTTDGIRRTELRCGKISGVYATVDFAPGTSVSEAFILQREFEPKGPLINSEFYPGWVTYWGGPLAHRDTVDVIDTLKQMLNRGANVNFYMFYGGTNFGFTGGADGDPGTYQSVITSYDYDAPITEAGDLTEKYYAIRDVIGEYLPLPNITVNKSSRVDYGELKLKATASLFSPEIRTTLGTLSQNKYPLSFEALGQNSGYLLYETEIQMTSTVSQLLFIKEVHDYALVFINFEFVGILSRELNIHEVLIKPVSQGDKLSILVENLGRIDYGPFINDSKGILSEILLGNDFLYDWNMTSFELKSLEPVERCFSEKIDLNCRNYDNLVFYMTKFTIAAEEMNDKYLNDTYIDVSNLTKGFVFVNGHNLGRYWSTRGPQKSLYLPGVFLTFPPSENVIVVLDETVSVPQLRITFSVNPVYDKTQDTRVNLKC